MQLKLLRHATVIIQMGKLRILVDPMLSRKGTLAPIAISPKMRPNPLVELLFDDVELSNLLSSIDGVIVTHTHIDHFDMEAAKRLLKEIPLFCQPEDETKLKKIGFRTAQSITKPISWNDITITRTGGRHGSILVNPFLGPVSGFILEMQGEPKVYLAGDTIWCKEIEQSLTAHQPDVIVANTGAARLLAGGLITMSCADIECILKILPLATIVAVHMEAFNHCLLTREKLRAYLKEKNLSGQVLVPNDGEEISL